ncbi:MAG: hypothetical protein AVDCRST_MAG52-3646, partial [uncultured Blastococcus sp.]
DHRRSRHVDRSERGGGARRRGRGATGPSDPGPAGHPRRTGGRAGAARGGSLAGMVADRPSGHRTGRGPRADAVGPGGRGRGHPLRGGGRGSAARRHPRRAQDGARPGDRRGGRERTGAWASRPRGDERSAPRERTVDAV